MRLGSHHLEPSGSRAVLSAVCREPILNGIVAAALYSHSPAGIASRSDWYDSRRPSATFVSSLLRSLYFLCFDRRFRVGARAGDAR